MNGAKLVKDRSAEVLKALKALANERVLVGIPAEAAARKPDPDEKGSPINNATLGYLNETGMPELNLPARPHLVPGVKRALPQITQIYRDAIPKVSLGGVAAARAAHTKVGVAAAASVKRMIDEGLSPPLAESTLAERKRNKRKRTNPLLDTGQYRNSITFVIQPAGGTKRKR